MQILLLLKIPGFEGKKFSLQNIKDMYLYMRNPWFQIYEKPSMTLT